MAAVDTQLRMHGEILDVLVGAAAVSVVVLWEATRAALAKTARRSWVLVEIIVIEVFFDV